MPTNLNELKQRYNEEWKSFYGHCSVHRNYLSSHVTRLINIQWQYKQLSYLNRCKTVVGLCHALYKLAPVNGRKCCSKILQGDVGWFFYPFTQKINNCLFWGEVLGPFWRLKPNWKANLDQWSTIYLFTRLYFFHILIILSGSLFVSLIAQCQLYQLLYTKWRFIKLTQWFSNC